MIKTVKSAACVILLCSLLICAFPVYAVSEVYAGGIPMGIKLYSGELRVIGFNEIDAQDKESCPAYDAGIRENDLILSVNDRTVTTASELVEECGLSQGKDIKIVCKRGDSNLTFVFKPALSEADGTYKTGMWIKDSTAGIGTVTYIIPGTNAFAGLGHAICNSRTGSKEKVENGIVTSAVITGVERGSEGDPGELIGRFSEDRVGTVAANTDEGIFGLLSEIPERIEKSDVVQISNWGKEGEAYIKCTLSGNVPELYKINIKSVDKEEKSNKNYVIEVTDDRLLEQTGGIVQGMSGSPIIQDGRLVGAVTHVFVNEPSKGFGISMERMLASMPDILA